MKSNKPSPRRWGKRNTAWGGEPGPLGGRDGGPEGQREDHDHRVQVQVRGEELGLAGAGATDEAPQEQGAEKRGMEISA